MDLVLGIIRYQGRGLNSFEPVNRNNFANEWNIYQNTPKQMMSADVHLFFSRASVPSTLVLLQPFFALFCSFLLPFYSVLLHFNKSHSELARWEFHRATWPLSCKSDLERNANFPRTNEYFKLSDWSFVVKNIVQFAIYLSFLKDLFIVKGEQEVLENHFKKYCIKFIVC